MTSRDIRQSFLDFFKSKQHEIVRSAPVIPADDPTLLFTNAGMNQFKDVFLGTGKRPYKRAADTQKCIRASGKHNDLEDVGRDTYHHTFFEMLGNWSFGDYYKEEAIGWAWELLTSVWNLPKDRLYATVYHDDDEAFEIWKNFTDIHPDHIQRHGKKDNFWEMGETGPCGPCTEIHIDLTPDKSGARLVNAGTPQVIEIWNLVFIQYNRNAQGELELLPAKHVDTGMGLERVAAVLQGKRSNYDTDLFKPLLDRIVELTGVAYAGSLEKETDVAMRVIADHIRALSFAIADGATPSNEGRGYVLRRILRRAVRYARSLGQAEPILHKIAPTLADAMGDVFPELVERQSAIEQIIRAEEENFLETLDRGIQIFSDIAAKVKSENQTIIAGSDVFKLYDTYGFPMDLTRLMAREIGLSIDEEGFERLMKEQKERARKDRKRKMAQGDDGDAQWVKLSSGKDSVFKGYASLCEKAKIRWAKKTDDRLFLVLDKTPFYAEAGGQVGDKGVIESGNLILRVIDTQKEGERIVHVIDRVAEASGKEIDVADLDFSMLAKDVVAKVDAEARLCAARNHTATHLLHAALRKVLGEHVQQKGSLVSPERLRFDFSHFEKVSEEQLARIEEMVNEQIRSAQKVIKHENVPFEEAKRMGALAFFGDKYGDVVRVLEIPNFSIEFCGGTHLDNVGQIGTFKIVSESSIASGIRRIEAVTGKAAEDLFRKEFAELQTLKRMLNAQSEEEIPAKIEKLLDEKKALEKQLEKLRAEVAAAQLDSLLNQAAEIGGAKVLATEVRAASADELRLMGEALRGKIKSGVALLASVIEGKVSLVATVSDDLIASKKLQAGQLIGDVAKVVQGGGGGRPQLATAGGKDPSKLSEAFNLFKSLAQQRLN
ncbi:MAG: alanine--tRNA ligase [Chloroherpetonaceae bacterium]|nr:alanine--tRNA ligase [Chloroherpetonaceae bacterium]MDW8437631.1 alanine--tRNA ligase [Chloroherpetonaceae bacterium]